MKRNRSRKTWDQSTTETKQAFLVQQPVTKLNKEYNLIREDIPPRYGDYLTQLERKNKEKRELNLIQGPKDPREEGFSLYFNGTHAQKGRARAKTGGQTDATKTKPNKILNDTDSLLPQTAPNKRKGWKVVSNVSLKTEDGNHLKVELSPKITGLYEDDFENGVTKHAPINVSSGGSDSEISDHCEEDLNTSISKPLHRAPQEMCRVPPASSRGPSRTTSTCSVTSVRVRQDLDESVADLQKAISAIQKENSDIFYNESPLPDDQPMRDSLETTFIDTECATQPLNTSQDYWRKHSMFGEIDTLTGVAVQLEVSSNWGHNSHLGLTEVEFFTTQNKKVWLSGTRVKVQGHIDTFEIDHILNGKTNTTHDKHMWSAGYRPHRRVRFHFLVPIGTKQEMGGVRIWNYNKPSCLDAGIRNVKIMVENVSVWEGEVPKGSGTKSNDYAYLVRINIPESSPSNASMSDSDVSLPPEKPNLIRQSNQLTKKRIPYNPFKSPNLVTTSEPTTPLQKTTSTQYKPHTSPQLTNNQAKLHHQLSDQLANQLSYKTTNQLAIKLSNQLPEKLTNQHSVKLINQLVNKPTNQLINKLPDHLPNQLIRRAAPRLKQSVSQNFLLDYLFSPPPNQLLEKSHSETELSKFLSADSPTCQAPKYGRRSQMRLGTAVTGIARPELPDAELTDITHLYNSKNRSSPILSHSRAYPSNAPSLKSSQTEPVISGAKAVPSLEEMLQSLATFQHSHRGRIVDLEEDSLDQFLEEQSRTRTSPLKLEPILEPEFVIPELPYGKSLSFIITSTWGDRYYLGLNGIEAFSSNGSKIEICDIVADPPDINILPGYGSDPRVAQNLTDGVNRTRDDLHMWLTPFTPGQPHLIDLEFSSPSKLAMLRIWNYNKSRIHSHRGARHIRIELDGTPVFVGEITRASGGLLGGTESFGDTILFTENENILALISENDETYLGDLSDEMECDLDCVIDDSFVSRPDTSDKERPFTTAGVAHEVADISLGDEIVAQKVSLCLLSNWDTSGLMGLTGVTLLAPDSSQIELTPTQLVMYKVAQDGTRVPLKVDTNHLLTDNLTQEEEGMLVWELEDGCQTLLEIILPGPLPLGGISIWNYNLTPEDTYNGVMQLDILLDDTFLSDYPFILRKAPGHLRYQFGQEIMFSEDSTTTFTPDTIELSSLMPLFTPELAPTGFVVELQILSTWGDVYYVGLSGIQLFDTNGHSINVSPKNVAAFPESINILEGVEGDLRTPDKLVDGVHLLEDGTHSWLAPLLPNTTTSVYFIFDTPNSFSAIRIWNYSKNQDRGVKEFSILIDDLIVYHATMPPAKPLDTQSDTVAPYMALLLDQSRFENSCDTSRATSEVMLCGDPMCRPFTSLTEYQKF
ncbi:hypothetical protein LOD99_1176 [Oopsacas minuta]|uniref:KATNIP domain-containing protein n=1 Tax=Oopsacas minuta TaxID=111878 RepID=A0AAV7K521_9METZ|nr:hypothetical protein LOD99_1176 [Oopsacas minuta]